MEHITDWSGIWHDFDVVEFSIRTPFSRRKKSARLFGPKTKIDSPDQERRRRTVRPEEKIALEKEEGEVRTEETI